MSLALPQAPKIGKPDIAAAFALVIGGMDAASEDVAALGEKAFMDREYGSVVRLSGRGKSLASFLSRATALQSEWAAPALSVATEPVVSAAAISVLDLVPVPSPSPLVVTIASPTSEVGAEVIAPFLEIPSAPAAPVAKVRPCVLAGSIGGPIPVGEASYFSREELPTTPLLPISLPSLDPRLPEDRTDAHGKCKPVEQRIREFYTRLDVGFLDGTRLKKVYACDTFALAIQHMGLEAVQALGILMSGLPLVNDNIRGLGSLNPGDYQEKDGKFIVVRGTTLKKKEILEEVGRLLNAGITVSAIK